VVPLWAARRPPTQSPHAELVVIERAAHLLPQQHPDRVAAVIAAATA
jgi:hypothetical protein